MNVDRLTNCFCLNTSLDTINIKPNLIVSSTLEFINKFGVLNYFHAFKVILIKLFLFKSGRLF